MRSDRHSSSRMIIRAGPGWSIAACAHDDTQARIIAMVSSPRSAIRDRSTVWIGAVKSGRTVVQASKSPASAPRTMPPSASVTGRIISRSSSTESRRTRSSRAISVVGSRSTVHTAGWWGWPGGSPSYLASPSPSGPRPRGPEASSIASDTAASSVGVSGRPSRMATSDAMSTQSAAVDLGELLGQPCRVGGQSLAERPGVQRVQSVRQSGTELDGPRAQRAGQRLVLVLQVADDESVVTP